MEVSAAADASESLLPKFDKKTGKPLNAAAKRLRKHQMSNAVKNAETTRGGAAAAYANAGTDPAELRRQALAQHPQVQHDIDVVANYDAGRMAELHENITLRIMLIGPPGAGKSSFINTARAVFSRMPWEEFAAVGSGRETVTEQAESFPLLADKPDHIRFTDTRGWMGLTQEAVGNIHGLSCVDLDRGTADMGAFEREVSKKNQAISKMAKQFRDVRKMHHAVIFFIDAHHLVRSARREEDMATQCKEVHKIYTSFRQEAVAAFEPRFFLTKVDKVREEVPTFEVERWVARELIPRINGLSASASAAPAGRDSNPQSSGGAPARLMDRSAPVQPLQVRLNQFHEMRSAGSRTEFDRLVQSNRWIEVQRLHAQALCSVLPQCARLIRREDWAIQANRGPCHACCGSCSVM